MNKKLDLKPTQKAELANALIADGWSITVEADLTGDKWWAEEAWRLEHVRGKNVGDVFVVFQIDPMDMTNSTIWAVSIQRSLADWADTVETFTLGKWPRTKNEMRGTLMKLLNESAHDKEASS